jgi:hypothetical protein
LNEQVLNQKMHHTSIPHKTVTLDELPKFFRKPGYHENQLHGSGSLQSQRVDLTKNPSKQIKTQKTDEVDITTTSAQPSERHLLGLSSKSETQSNVIRVFHGIYSTKEG